MEITWLFQNMVLHTKITTVYSSDEWTSQEQDLVLCSEISNAVPGICIKSAVPIQHLYLPCLDVFRILTCLVFCALIFQCTLSI